MLFLFISLICFAAVFIIIYTRCMTIAMNSLVKKGYVVRRRGDADRRVVYISLSDRGRSAYEHHARFHREMIQSVMEELEPGELETLIRALTKLNDWFRGWKKE